jgi:glycosyltransferase involved in cell wall biosynthesis
MRIAWISFLDVNMFSGGGELAQRELLAVGRRRGHTIVESAFLRGRLQRLLRRTGGYRRLRVDWDADIFVLSNLRNSPQLGLPFPERLIEKILATRRVVLIEDAWVDTCELDMPCGGDRSACPASCDRTWSNQLYARVQVAVFVSPMQRRMIRSVLDAPLPPFQIVRRPYVDASHFRPLGLERDIDVLYVGAINEAKGYRNLIERFGADRLTFVGRNGLDESLAGTYLGELRHHELPQIYNRARTFAHLPQWHEPMGRTVIEAALCGCEVITNERVGATSFPRSEWTDPNLIAGHGERFWIEFEGAAQQLVGTRPDAGPSIGLEPAKT